MTKKNIQPAADKKPPPITKATVQKGDVPFPWMIRKTVSLKKDGTCNVLVIVPHGHDDYDTNAEKLGAYLADALDSYAVINNQLYRKPPKGGQPNLTNHLMDLNVPKQARQCVDDYWNPLLNFAKEINKKHGQRALLFFIHGIGDDNADAQIPAPDIIVGKGFIPNPNDPKVGKYDAKAASASEMFFDELIDSIKNMGVVRDDVPNYQGSKALPRHLYQERRKLGIDIEAVQLEFRNRRYRDTPENWSRRGKELAGAIQSMTSSFKSWSNEVVQLISAEKFKSQIDGLRQTTSIKNDMGEEVPFDGETKDEFIRFCEEGYPVAEKMLQTVYETGRFLYEVRKALKPKKLFLTWMEFTGYRDRRYYRYLRVYGSFREKLTRFSHLGIRKLEAASSLKDSVEYLERHREEAEKQTVKEFEQAIRKVKSSGKTGARGRKPSYETIGGCKVRQSKDGKRIMIEGLSKRKQSALFETIKVELSKKKR